MKILGIDTGTHKTGWCLYDSEKHIILDKGKDKNSDCFDIFNKLHKDNKIDVVALEMVASYGMVVGQEVFYTCVTIGQFVQWFKERGYKTNFLFKKGTSYRELFDLDDNDYSINIAICDSNKATDKNIRQAIIDMFPPEGGGSTPQIGTKAKQGRLYGISGDMWSALAVCLTYALNKNLIKRRVY